MIKTQLDLYVYITIRILTSRWTCMPLRFPYNYQDSHVYIYQNSHKNIKVPCIYQDSHIYIEIGIHTSLLLKMMIILESEAGILEKKRNPSAPIRTRT